MKELNTSFWYLKEKGKDGPIVKLELYIYPYGATVLNVEIYDMSRIPLKIKKIIEVNNGKIPLDGIFQAFIDERIPRKMDGDETDEWVIEQLELRRSALQTGRLTRYCGFIPVINYFQSESDNYWIVPEKKQIFYFGYTETGFVKVYEIDVPQHNPETVRTVKESKEISRNENVKSFKSFSEITENINKKL